MGIKAKAAGLLVGFGVIAISGLALASGVKKKKAAPKPSGNAMDATEDDDDDVSLVTPGPDGSPTGPEILIDPNDLPKPISAPGEVLPAEEHGTPTDKRLDEIAAQEGATEGEAVAEIVDAVTAGQGESELSKVETSPALDPHGTVALARILLAREELPGWKSDLQAEVKLWQGRLDLKPDGLFGPTSLRIMSSEVGVLPLVRYFPKSVYSKAQAKALAASEVNRAILALKMELPDSQPQIDALTLSMGREKAQAFGTTNPAPQNTRAFVQSVNDAIAEIAEKSTEKELANA